MLPKQATRGSGLTIMGAVGGLPGGVIRFIYLVTNRTNKLNVVEFFKHFSRKISLRRKKVVIYTDNHSAHHSYLVRDHVAKTNIDLRFIPAYSSPLSV